MVDSVVFVAEVAVPMASLPDFEVQLRKGETTYRATVTINTAFTATQLAGCVVGASLILGLKLTGGMLNYTGVVNGYGCRAGYSIVQIDTATCEFVPDPE